MTGISHHDFPSVEQERMIISWPAGKARFERHLTYGHRYSVYFTAAGKTKTILAGGESTKHPDEAGGKESKVDRHANRQLPGCDQMPPQESQDNEVGPDSDL